MRVTAGGGVLPNSPACTSGAVSKELWMKATRVWFADSDNRKLLTKFTDLGVRPHYESHARGPLHGKSFVITGTLERMGRDEAAEQIRRLGGTFQTSVGKDTSYLVVGQHVGEAKLKRAAQLGTYRLTEAELLAMLQQR